MRIRLPAFSSVQIALAGLIVILIGLVWINHDRVQRANERVRAAETQAELNAAAVQQLDHFTTTTTVIREKAQEAERVVQSAPGAGAPLDPDNRSVVCAELERVRGSAVCTD
jgi:hypothetical protein